MSQLKHSLSTFYIIYISLYRMSTTKLVVVSLVGAKKTVNAHNRITRVASVDTFEDILLTLDDPPSTIGALRTEIMARRTATARYTSNRLTRYTGRRRTRVIVPPIQRNQWQSAAPVSRRRKRETLSKLWWQSDLYAVL